MFEDLTKIRELPDGVRKSIYFTIAAWLGHFAWFFVYFPGKIPMNLFYKHLAMGTIICVFLILRKPWAKWLGVMGSIIVILYYVPLTWITFAHKGRPVVAMGMVFIIALFGTSTYYLFSKDSIEFFKVKRDDTNPALDDITSGKGSRKNKSTDFQSSGARSTKRKK